MNTIKNIFQQQASTLFLKGAIIGIGTVVLLLCIFLLPQMAKAWTEYLYIASLHYVVLAGMYATAVPFFIALYQAFKLLNAIDKGKAFSDRSIQALKAIKYCALTISMLYAIGLPLFFFTAEADDAPGLMVFGLIVTFTPVAIAVFVAVLQQLLRSAIAMKSENELTV